MDDFKISLQGELDVNSTLKRIQTQLKGKKVTLDVDLNINNFSSKEIGQDLNRQIDSVINSVNSKINKLNSTLNNNQSFNSYQNSTDGWNSNLNKLSNTWIKFINNFVDNGSAKTVISLLEGFVGTLDKFSGLTGSVGALITAITGIKGEGRGKMIPFNKYALVDTGGNTERVYIFISYKQGCLGKTA